VRLFRPQFITALGILGLLLTNTTFVENEQSGFVTTGTSIAIIAKENQIAAAADSKILLGRDRFSSTDCKIKQFEDIFFAIAGHRREVLSNFDAIYIAMEACKTTSNIADRMSKFELLIKPALFNMLWVNQRKDPSYFESNLLDKTILQAAFFGFERGAPYLFTRSYKCKLASGRIVIDVESQGCLSQCDMLAVLGKSRAIEQYIIRTPAYKKKPSVELAQELVELEIADEPNIVGPPIDILQISKTGPVWKQRKPDCP
jgi:hypothetical protein